ncbi:MAG TPA: hypothetical protein VG184_11725 [Acidimicrobiales bacterium]|nr:hypothetical protein [Acidimicrobiales bacterium]
MATCRVLECVVNVSEGRDHERLARLAAAAGNCLLDLHADAYHHRSVFTMAGTTDEVDSGVRSLAATVVAEIDLHDHQGAHPRLGAVDVVPFVALESDPSHPGPEPVLMDGDIADAVAARERFVRWAADALALPCFRYGPERSLPDVRRRAWADLAPDAGPPQPHPGAGACTVGARPLLVAYNLWLDAACLASARRIATDIRGPQLRALGLAVGGGVQVSCNLTAPRQVGPAAAYDAVASRASVARAEVVGLVPRAVLEATPRQRWSELGLSPSATIEARLAGRASMGEGWGKAGAEG